MYYINRLTGKYLMLVGGRTNDGTPDEKYGVNDVEVIPLERGSSVPDCVREPAQFPFRVFIPSGAAYTTDGRYFKL